MGKVSQLPSLSEAQMEIMEVVWDRGRATVGEIWRVLQERRPVARNTVQTVVTRLEEKGWLRHQDESGIFRFEAAHPRTTAVRGLVRRLLDTAFGGSASGLMMTLLEEERLSPEETERLRELIDRSEARGKSRRARP